MSKYENVTFLEYHKKKLEMFDDLGRTREVCSGVNCNICPFSNSNNGLNEKCSVLEDTYPEKALEIVMEYEPKVDWENVPVDAKILVKKYEDDTWHERHFAKYEDGKVYAWRDGLTSFTAKREAYIGSWKYAKLYKE